MKDIKIKNRTVPAIGISSCLLRGDVRYDGEDKRDLHLINRLSCHVKLIAVCPEVECGFSVPREAVILTGDKNNPQFRTKYSKIDHTKKMDNWCLQKIDFFRKNQLHGFIFKSKSPSCAINSVKLYDLKDNIISEQERGLFAKQFIQAFPKIPVIEESALTNQITFDNFIKKVMNYKCK